MSIQDKISELRQYRDDTRTIINYKGVNLPEGSDMNVYSDAIDSINSIGAESGIIIDLKTPLSSSDNFRLEGLAISKYEEPLIIPEYIGDTLVTSIGDYAFQNNIFTSVILPDSLTSIGRRAFSNNQITSITLPDDVTSVGSYAFADNPLTEVIIGPNTTYQSNSFPDSAVITVKEIGDDIHGLPGPKTLQYKEVGSSGRITGYFGEVSEEEMGIGVAEAMRSINGFSSGTRRYPDNTPLWHKFLYNGTIYYVSNFTPYEQIAGWSNLKRVTSQTQIIPDKPDLSIRIEQASSTEIGLLRNISEEGSWGINIPFTELNTHRNIADYPTYDFSFSRWTHYTYNLRLAQSAGITRYNEGRESGPYSPYVVLYANTLPNITEDD